MERWFEFLRPTYARPTLVNTIRFLASASRRNRVSETKHGVYFNLGANLTSGLRPPPLLTLALRLTEFQAIASGEGDGG